MTKIVIRYRDTIINPTIVRVHLEELHAILGGWVLIILLNVGSDVYTIVINQNTYLMAAYYWFVLFNSMPPFSITLIFKQMFPILYKMLNTFCF